MAFDRPTLRQLMLRFQADLRAYTEGGDALLRSSVERALARIVPGLTHGLHGHLARVVRQLLPDTCDEPQVLRWAAILGLTLKPAAPAAGPAEFATTGPSIPLGELVQRGDGVQYEVTSAAVESGVVKVELLAVVAGAAGNADPATPLALVSPVAGVDSEGEVIGDGLTDGTDVETAEQLRARVLQRLSTPPRGGGRGDYVAWALEVPGVTRAWETPRVAGAGTVGVQFVTDGEADPIPSSGKVTEVQDYLVARAPVTIGRSIDGEWVGVITTAPVALPLVIEIADLVPNTAAVQAAIKAEVVDFLLREAEPGKADGSTVLYRSRLDEAISRAAGETSHTLVLPAADVAVPPGELPIYDDVGFPITWS